jgi:hypothetical protein
MIDDSNPVYLLHIEYGGRNFPHFSVHATQQEALNALWDRALNDDLIDDEDDTDSVSREQLLGRFVSIGVLPRIHRCTGRGSEEIKLIPPLEACRLEQAFDEFWANNRRRLAGDFAGASKC